jgi:hypothetical protein
MEHDQPSNAHGAQQDTTEDVADRSSAPEPLEINVSEQVQTASELVLHMPLNPAGSGSEAIRIEREGPDARSAAANYLAGGDVTDHIEERASGKATSELRTSALLVERLNDEGGQWHPPQRYPGDREQGIDCMSTSDDGATLNIQVTRPEREAWEQLVTGPFDRTDPDVSRAVEALRVAIEGKARLAGRSEIVLALDATDSAVYSLQRVVEAFRETHGKWAAGVGYASIWVVGPGKELVLRLDALTSDP